MSSIRTISKEELSKHTSIKDCWISIRGKVYDVTKYEKHPGGRDVYSDFAGQDATIPFDDEGHSAAAIKQMAEYFVGTLEGGDENDDETEEVIDTNSGSKMRISKKKVCILKD